MDRETKAIIEGVKEIMDEKFRELLFDPDEGLELKEEIEQRLRASLLSTERITFEEVKKRAGL